MQIKTHFKVVYPAQGDHVLSKVCELHTPDPSLVTASSVAQAHTHQACESN